MKRRLALRSVQRPLQHSLQRPFQRLIALLAAAFCLVALTACAREPLTQREAFVFGTRIEISLAEPDVARAEAAAAAALAEFDRLHRLYHAWQPSELQTLNAALAAGETAAVSPELATLLKEAQAIARAGDYLFDPGIGGLVALWGFHADSFTAQLPDPAALAAWQQAAPSIADLSIDGNTVRSRNRRLALDFGGYLKGVALDNAAAILRRHGVNNALLNVGGNVMALGSRYGRPWRVGIQQPRAAGALATLELADGEAIGTSGDYQRFFELDGVRYSHLLDPRRAAPVQHTQALSVLIAPAPDAGMRSDAASKPLFIAGPAAWPRYLAPLGVAGALRVDQDGSVEVSAGLARRLRLAEGVRARIVVTPVDAPPAEVTRR